MQNHVKHPLKPATALVAGLIFVSLSACGDDPGYTGLLPPVLNHTSFIDPDIIVPTDPTAFTAIVANGSGSRTMYDGRTASDVTVDAWLFDADYDDGLTVEVQVNPEFGDSIAAVLAEKYAAALGRLPNAIRDGIDEIWVQGGDADFGNGTNAIYLHVDRADQYEADGFLEESLAPEAARATIQLDHGGAAAWIEAQGIDNRFISSIAQDAPETEDVAQSFLPYFAVVHRSDRITDFLAATIINAIPARLNYFDAQSFDMHPLN